MKPESATGLPAAGSTAASTVASTAASAPGTAASFAMPVEFGKAREFAAATLAVNTVWYDPAVARQAGLPGLPVVPVYVMATEHYAPRPLIGADGLPGGVRSLYGQMEFEWLQPIHVGDTLIVRPGAVTVTERQGRRGGAMTLTTTETLFEKDGVLALVRRGTRIVTGVDVSTIPTGITAQQAAAATGGGGGGNAAEAGAAVGAAATAPVKASAAMFATATPVYLNDGAVLPLGSARGIAPGVMVQRDVTVDRVMIARYAGASGDFAPIHLDESVARLFGNASVFAHGMLSGGIMGSLLADWVGAAALRRYRARFVAKVFPGDAITYRVLVTACQPDAAGTRLLCALRATNQEGLLVLEGDAEAVLPA